jgi:predicted methyltransferase
MVSCVGGCRDPGEAAASAARDETKARVSRGLSPEDYDRWRQPERVVAALELAAGQTVADIGAGSGYFTTRLAEAVGPRGRVTATDIDPRALSALDGLARRAGASGAPIEVRRVEPDDPGLAPGQYDRVLLAQVDHLLADRADYLRRLRAALAPGGRVAVSNRIQHRAGLVRAAQAAGYSIAADVTELPGQFVLLLAPDRETSP